jgi:RimJ/RimL family protein N-acetyltransferase
VIEIRRLLSADAAAYRALMLDAYAQHPEAFTSSASERAAQPLDWWVQRLAEDPSAPQRVHGALDVNELIGAAGWSIEPREKIRHKAVLFGMYVRPGHRGTGIGRRLVDAVLADLRTVSQIRQVVLTVTAGNRQAQSLYEACGFVPFGLEPRAIRVGDRYHDKVHLWRPIEPAAAATTDPEAG